MRQDISVIANRYSVFTAYARYRRECRQNCRGTAWFVIQDADPGLARVVTASAIRPDVNCEDRTTILAITPAHLDAVRSRFKREHDLPPIERPASRDAGRISPRRRGHAAHHHQRNPQGDIEPATDEDAIIQRGGRKGPRSRATGQDSRFWRLRVTPLRGLLAARPLETGMRRVSGGGPLIPQGCCAGTENLTPGKRDRAGAA
jgi:hypothetical protein